MRAGATCASMTSVPPVVLLHGLIGPFADSRAVSLLRPADVVCPDLLGYGSEADTDPDRITIDSQVRYVQATMDRTAPDAQVHLVGHSAGGIIAMVLAHRIPDRVV